jgi:hypothetical protein
VVTSYAIALFIVLLIKVMFSSVKFPKDCQAYGTWAEIDIVRVSNRASLQMKALLLRSTNIRKVAKFKNYYSFQINS